MDPLIAAAIITGVCTMIGRSYKWLFAVFLVLYTGDAKSIDNASSLFVLSHRSKRGDELPSRESPGTDE